MKLLKNPVFAVFLAVVVVISSTLINTNVKLGRKSAAVSDLFYEGVTASGYTRPSIASHLENIGGFADGLAAIARNNGIDAGEVEQDVDMLRGSVSSGDMFLIRSNYSSLLSAMTKLIDSLERASLDERDASGVEQYKSSLNGAQSAIAESGYNEAVRDFLRRYDRFPSRQLGAMAGVPMPETFN